MKEIAALAGISLIVLGAHTLWGAYADIAIGVLLLIESHSMSKKTGESNDS
jgi:hypothetical protein